MIEMCVNLGIHILNGRKQGRESNEFTCITSNGQSVVDYILCSSELYDYIDSFSVVIDDFTQIGLDHFPVMCTLHLKNCLITNMYKVENIDNDVKENVLKFRWRDECKEHFCKLMTDDDSINQFAIYDSLCDKNEIDRAIELLENVLYRASECMQVKTCVKKTPRHGKCVPWWDQDLFLLKSKRNGYLRLFRSTKNVTYINAYIKSKRYFKLKFRRKQCLYKDRLYTQLKACKTLDDYWKMLKRLRNKKIPGLNISQDDWYVYFFEMLNDSKEKGDGHTSLHYHTFCNHNVTCEQCKQNFPPELNVSISVREVTHAIQSMKNNKAPGPDGIVIEMFKAIKVMIAPILCKLFNIILDNETFPITWGRALIHTIYKSGDPRLPSNYRGISLLNTTSKLLTKILNERLVDWAEAEDKYYSEQAGFRRGYSTTDQIFNLHTVANKCISKKKGRMYAAFVDFARAFDCIPHVGLLVQLQKRGVHGKILGVIRSMYSNLKACVKTPSGITEWFKCNVGTRQGCMLSPFLFTMYLNEFIENIKMDEFTGIQLDGQDAQYFVNALLYADDMVLCGDSIGNLQRLIGKLENFCKEWNMTVNFNKTKIVVFRAGGPLKHTEKWFFDNKQLDTVSSYRYLGLQFSSSLKWNIAHWELAKRSARAVINIRRLYYKCGHMPASVLFDIFDKKIVPILSYGAEIWGYESSDWIECVHTKFCKWVLGVSSSTPNAAVLAECGRFPLYISSSLYVCKVLFKNYA